MNAPVGDEGFRKYAPRRIREGEADHDSATAVPDREPPSPSGDPERSTASTNRRQSVSGAVSADAYSGSTRISSAEARRTTIKMTPAPDLGPERGARLGQLTLVIVASAGIAALLAIFAMPLLQHFSLPSQPHQSYAYKSDEGPAPNARAAQERPAEATADNGPTDRRPVAAKQVAVATTTAGTVAVAQAQQTAQAQLLPRPQPLRQEPAHTTVPVRGVSDHEIRFGIAAPFSGAAKELGQGMRLGIESAFDAANASGGVYGRQLRLIAADDGYEPARTAEAMKTLYEKDQVFGVIGNVGTPTAAVSLPYALDHKMLFFGAFTGSGLLRADPPDRYVFNYRASYAEETAAVVDYLVKVKRLKPEQLAVFAQQDAYGDAGFSGVARAVRSLGGDDRKILRLGYTRNTVDVEGAVAQLHQHQKRTRNGIKAVIMVPTYRAAARFIEKTRDEYPNMIYTSVSFVGSTALANELMLLGKKYAAGIIVTQVVPAADGHSSLALDYKAALAKYFPGEPTDYVSFEGYVAAKILIESLKRNGAQLDPDRLVDTLENMHNLDIGLGAPISFGRSEHQAVHKVWGSQLTDTGHYQAIELE